MKLPVLRCSPDTRSLDSSARIAVRSSRLYRERESKRAQILRIPNRLSDALKLEFHPNFDGAR